MLKKRRTLLEHFSPQPMTIVATKRWQPASGFKASDLYFTSPKKNEIPRKLWSSSAAEERRQ
jgi:hypothetical protein